MHSLEFSLSTVGTQNWPTTPCILWPRYCIQLISYIHVTETVKSARLRKDILHASIIVKSTTQTCTISRLSDSEFFLSASNKADKLLTCGESFNSAVMIHCFVTSLQLRPNHCAKHSATSSDVNWSFRQLYSPTVCHKTTCKCSTLYTERLIQPFNLHQMANMSVCSQLKWWEWL